MKTQSEHKRLHVLVWKWQGCTSSDTIQLSYSEHGKPTHSVAFQSRNRIVT